MWELDCEEGWALKNWCFWTVVLEKTLQSHLDCKEIKPVNPKGDESWIFIGKTETEAEAPILWPPDAKNWFIRKDPDAGRASLVTQLLKNPPAMWETWVWSFNWEDPLEKGTTTHSSFLAWRIPWAIPWGHNESDTTVIFTDSGKDLRHEEKWMTEH